jgi:DNA polymerase-1
MSKRSRQPFLHGFDDVQDAVAEDAPLPQPGPPEANHSVRTVYAIDAYSLIFQVFHALPDMTSPTGQPVAAIHGFTRDIVDLLENKRPDYLFCAFDAPGPTFRDERYEQYKANRAEIPADLQMQIPQIRRMLDAMHVPVLQREGYEADDVLATLARHCRQRGWRCVIVTSDKDCRQLISDKVSLYNIRKSQEYDAASLLADWGIRPDQVVDFQALVGDSVDNVPGVPLIGPKIARELLEKYGTLEGVLEHASEVSGKKRRENLLQGREAAFLSRDLVRLVDDVPVQIDWDAGRVGPIDSERVAELCREFGFRGIAKRLGVQEDEATAESVQADYRTVTTWDELQQLVDQLAHQRQIAVDTETTSTNPRWAEIVGYSFAWQPHAAWYVPVRAPAGEPQLDALRVRDALRPILEDPQIEKIGQNLKYDLVVLRSAGIRLQGVSFDTMVADYLLDPGERNHGIDELAKRYLGYAKITTQDVIGTGKKQKRMDQVPVALVAPYACEDADIALRLAERLRAELEQKSLIDLFRNLEMPLIDVLAEMEFNGIRVDAGRLTELGERFGRRMAELEQEIYALAGGTFNIDSRQQLGKVLFEDLQLPASKKTKTGPSTDVSVLTELAGQHALPAKIIEYRQYAKLKSTYVDSLIELVHPVTGRVHTSFKQDVAATGRLSSKDPNLQNIPVRTEEGRAIRSAFLAGEAGWKLLAADYSQIELRVLAHFCGDPTLQNAFATDQDIHALVASEVHGVPLGEVTREMRRRAKAVNFGVIYGQSAFGLGKALQIGTEQAAEFIEAYFARYSGVDDFIMKTLAECRENGYVSTILGRRRIVEGVRESSSPSDSRQRNLPERIAINTVIQGSAADLIKKAMINVRQRMQRESVRARMLLQIHDELVFEVPSNEVDNVATLVREEMAEVQRLAVPLKVDVKVGSNWADCEAWD